MLMVCVLFVVNAGRIFSWAIVEMNELRGREIKNTALSAVCFSIHFLSVLCTVYVFVAYVLAFYFSPFFSLTLFFIMTWTGIESFYASMHPLSFSYVKRGQAIIRLYTFGGNTICYLSCWLVIGIRINPSWGLTVALFIISIFASSTYAVYLYLEVIYPNGYNIREREDTLQDLLWGTYSFVIPARILTRVMTTVKTLMTTQTELLRFWSHLLLRKASRVCLVVCAGLGHLLFRKA